VLARLLREIAPGETLVVVRLDRLARSVNHLLAVIEELDAKAPISAARVIRSAPQRRRVCSRYRYSARSLSLSGHWSPSGPKPGCGPPASAAAWAAIRACDARDPEAVRKARAARDAAHLNAVLVQLYKWLPIVRRMPSDQPWGDVVRVLNRTTGLSWTPERLRRTVRRLAAEKIVEPGLLDPAPRKPAADRLLVLVAGIASAVPDCTLPQIASQLEGMRAHAARRNRWHASSVRHLLRRAERLGLLGAPSPALPLGRTRAIAPAAFQQPYLPFSPPSPDCTLSPAYAVVRAGLCRRACACRQRCQPSSRPG
jgi:hypothetical protein